MPRPAIPDTLTFTDGDNSLTVSQDNNKLVISMKGPRKPEVSLLLSDPAAKQLWGYISKMFRDRHTIVLQNEAQKFLRTHGSTMPMLAAHIGRTVKKATPSE